MGDLILNYRACGAECREDWLRMLANENGLPFGAVQRLAEELGEREEFEAAFLAYLVQSPRALRVGIDVIAKPRGLAFQSRNRLSRLATAGHRARLPRLVRLRERFQVVRKRFVLLAGLA